MNQHDMEVLGVFVVKNRNGYTGPALEKAKKSPYQILLTDIKSLPSDLPNFQLRKTGRNKKIQKKINKIQGDMSKMREDVSSLMSLKEQVNKLERYLIMLIIVIIIGIIYIHFLLSK